MARPERGETVTKLLTNGGYFQGVVLCTFQNLSGDWLVFCEGPIDNYFVASPHSLHSTKKDIILVSSSL